MLWEAEASPCLVAPIMPRVPRHRKLKCLSILSKSNSFHNLGDRLISEKWRKMEWVKRDLADSQLGNSEIVHTFQTGAFMHQLQPMFYACVFYSL